MSLNFQGAVIREQGVTFAIVVVKKHIVDNRLEAQNLIGTLQPIFTGIPIVLMAQDYRGTPTFFGRRDIAAFMAKVPLYRIPWKRITYRAA